MEAQEQGRETIEIPRNRGKSKKSLRSLPLVPELRQMLLDVKKRQEYYRDLCGNCYNQADADYIYTDEMGTRIRPDYITQAFPRFLELNGFEKMRFHDLRHTSGSLLVSRGVPMKLVQEWLGHSDFTVTANVYAHLDKSVTSLAAEKLGWIQKTNLSGEAVAEPADVETANVNALLMEELTRIKNENVQISAGEASALIALIQGVIANHQPV